MERFFHGGSGVERAASDVTRNNITWHGIAASGMARVRLHFG
jgi:hypothetical protein